MSSDSRIWSQKGYFKPAIAIDWPFFQALLSPSPFSFKFSVLVMQGASETIPRTLSVNFMFSASKGKESDLQPMKGTTLTDISDSGKRYLQCWALFLCIVTVRVSWEIIQRFSRFRRFSLAPFKINWVPQSLKLLFAESQILRFGIRDSAQVIQIPEFTFR